MNLSLILLASFGTIIWDLVQILIFAGLVIISCWEIRRTYLFYNKGGDKLYPRQAYSKLVTTALLILATILCYLFFFENHGNGTPINDSGREAAPGYHQYIKESPETPSKKRINKLLEDKKPEELKLQDSSFKYFKDKANKFVEDAVKEAKKRDSIN